jgi:Spx/MgsR family transcriptional regulator
MKKTFAWFSTNQMPYVFHDYKKQGIDLALLSLWADALGWENLINRRGSTWRKLPSEAQANLNQERALQLMQQTPSLIKRPLITFNNTVHIGFNPSVWSDWQPPK